MPERSSTLGVIGDGGGRAAVDNPRSFHSVYRHAHCGPRAWRLDQPGAVDHQCLSAGNGRVAVGGGHLGRSDRPSPDVVKWPCCCSALLRAGGLCRQRANTDWRQGLLADVRERNLAIATGALGQCRVPWGRFLGVLLAGAISGGGSVFSDHLPVVLGAWISALWVTPAIGRTFQEAGICALRCKAGARYRVVGSPSKKASRTAVLGN
ncbi:hypothetical protein FQR65_LT20305 [Abscondita terminalis]|nr:hypothetical protein FQR65_LT20305 [Abscondita terminalis]